MLVSFALLKVTSDKQAVENRLLHLPHPKLNVPLFRVQIESLQQYADIALQKPLRER